MQPAAVPITVAPTRAPARRAAPCHAGGCASLEPTVQRPRLASPRLSHLLVPIRCRQTMCPQGSSPRLFRQCKGFYMGSGSPACWRVGTVRGAGVSVLGVADSTGDRLLSALVARVLKGVSSPEKNVASFFRTVTPAFFFFLEGVGGSLA